MSKDIICGRIATTGFAKGRHDQEKAENSFFSGTWEELETLVAENFHRHLAPQNMIGGTLAVEIPVPVDGFYAGELHVSEIKDGEQVFAEVKGRFGVEGDQVRKSTWVERDKLPPAKQVIIALYQSGGLGPYSTLKTEDPTDWEIVSVNATTSPEVPKMAFDTMCHNDFGSAGGSERIYENIKEHFDTLKASFQYSRNTIAVRVKS